MNGQPLAAKASLLADNVIFQAGYTGGREYGNLSLRIGQRRFRRTFGCRRLLRDRFTRRLRCRDRRDDPRTPA
jgi:hypothetical protein